MLLARSELLQLGEPDSEFTTWLESLPPPSDDYTSAEPTRRVMARMSKATLARLGAPPASIHESYHEIPMRDGFASRLKISKPSSTGAPGPLIVLAFGGGFIAGDVDQLTEFARVATALFGATAVCISYRVAPEHKFPVPQLDAIDSLRWIADNATGPLLAADPSKGFILGGVSAGAGITACLSRFFQAEAEKLAHPLTGQWLCVPSLMTADSCPEKFRPYYLAREQNATAPFLNTKSTDLNFRLLQPDVTSPLRSPLNSENAIGDQPRTYIQVDGLDPLRDDGLVYDEMLKEAGVETRVDVYPGCSHGHMFGMRGTEIGDRGLVDIAQGLAWLLRTTVTKEEARTALGLSA